MVVSRATSVAILSGEGGGVGTEDRDGIRTCLAHGPTRPQPQLTSHATSSK
jgi:hypothetical protein